MNDYWTIAQRHIAGQRARRDGCAPDHADILDDGHVAHVRPPDADLDADRLDAARIASPTYGDVWLVADTDALDRHPDIAASGCAVITFREIDRLRDMTPAERRAYIALRRVFPTASPIH